MNTGEVVKQIRTNHNLTIEEFAYNILLAPDELAEIEIGNGEVSESTLQLIANVYSLDIAGLRQGRLVEQVERNSLMQELKEIRNDLVQIKEDSKFLRKFMKRWGIETTAESKQYHVVEHMDKQREQAEDKEVYVIVDTFTGEYVTSDTGEMRIWKDRESAMNAAELLNELDEKNDPEKDLFRKDHTLKGEDIGDVLEDIADPNENIIHEREAGPRL